MTDAPTHAALADAVRELLAHLGGENTNTDAVRACRAALAEYETETLPPRRIVLEFEIRAPSDYTDHGIVEGLTDGIPSDWFEPTGDPPLYITRWQVAPIDLQALRDIVAEHPEAISREAARDSSRAAAFADHYAKWLGQLYGALAAFCDWRTRSGAAPDGVPT